MEVPVCLGRGSEVGRAALLQLPSGMRRNVARGRAARIRLRAGSTLAVYLDVDWTRPSAIVVGNEGIGCSEDMRECADEWVVVPQQGMADSLNVSVAASILLGEAYRQRLQAGMYAPRWSEAKERTLRTWVARQTPPLQKSSRRSQKSRVAPRT